MKTSIPPDLAARLTERVSAVHARAAARPAGEPTGRQPVHVVYGGAHLFRADVAQKLGARALESLDAYAPDAATLAKVLDLPEALAPIVYERVRGKLAREPVEDYRIDFEDGYGYRPDAEEDTHAAAAAREASKGIAAGTLPPFWGIRVKSFGAGLVPRALRTLDVFLTELVKETGAIAPGFVVTLPKVADPEEVRVLVTALEALEAGLGLAKGALRLEVMVETPQAILGPDGGSNLARIVDAGSGRCVAAHFGTYDYTAALGVTAAHQSMTHPACDFAKHMMQVALAGTGVALSDGATNVMPVGPHRAAPGTALTPSQARENAAVVRAAWRLHYTNIRHSLAGGFYEGWDLHPAQLVARYAAVYAFFLEGLEAASERLRNFVAKAAQATRVGQVFDDAATGQGLINSFLRGLHCGAVSEEEVRATGLTPEEIRARSFADIVRSRSSAA